MREKCPDLEFFWSVFSRIWTKYGPEQLRIRTLHAVLPTKKLLENVSLIVGEQLLDARYRRQI